MRSTMCGISLNRAGIEADVPPPEAVTTVVVTRNRRSQLLQVLRRATGRVVVVDNGSSDGTAEAVRTRFPGVHVAALPDNRGALARNLGVLVARTPYVAFADDDSWWEPGALAEAVRLLDGNPAWGAVVARVLVDPGERLDPMTAQMLAESPRIGTADAPAMYDVCGFHACAVVLRSSDFFAAGGFDPVVFFGGEEERLVLDLLEADRRIVLVPSLVVHHEPRDEGRNGSRRGRDRLVTRNAVLTAVMRRPWPVVLRRCAEALRQGQAGSLVDTLPRLRSALSARRPVSAAVERHLAACTGRRRPTPRAFVGHRSGNRDRS